MEIQKDKKPVLELMKFLYKIQTMGNGNSMVRRYFDETGELKLWKQKNWQKFIDGYVDILIGESDKLPNIRVKTYEFKTKKK